MCLHRKQWWLRCETLFLRGQKLFWSWESNCPIHNYQLPIWICPLVGLQLRTVHLIPYRHQWSLQNWWMCQFFHFLRRTRTILKNSMNISVSNFRLEGNFGREKYDRYENSDSWRNPTYRFISKSVKVIFHLKISSGTFKFSQNTLKSNKQVLKNSNPKFFLPNPPKIQKLVQLRNWAYLW